MRADLILAGCFAAVAVLAPAPLAAQNQVVASEPRTVRFLPGEDFEFAVEYSTEPAEPSLTGLGLRMHWDSRQVSFLELGDVFPDTLVAQGLPEPDLLDLDGDSLTDTFLLLAWIDLDGDWPGTPARTLYRARFRAADGFSGSRVNFTSPSTAAGWGFSAPRTLLRLTEDGACPAGDDTLCLNGDRFQVQVDWRDFSGNTGVARVVPVSSADSGLFWFFQPDNWEMLVKVLDGCAITDHFWVFAAATTNVEYTLRVTDTVSGESQSYFNPLGQAAAAITDTEALAVCDP